MIEKPERKRVVGTFADEFNPSSANYWRKKRTPEELAELDAELDRTILVTFFRDGDGQPWTATLKPWTDRQKGANWIGITAQGATIKAARRNVRAALEAAVGTKSATEHWRCHDEMMPAGAEREEEIAAKRRARRKGKPSGKNRTRARAATRKR